MEMFLFLGLGLGLEFATVPRNYGIYIANFIGLAKIVLVTGKNSTRHMFY